MELFEFTYPIGSEDEEAYVKCIIENLCMLKEDYIDDTPFFRVKSTHSPNNFKCRRGWWEVVMGNLVSLQEIGSNYDQIISQGYDITEKYCKSQRENNRQMLAESISEMNDLIARTIADLGTLSCAA